MVNLLPETDEVVDRRDDRDNGHPVDGRDGDEVNADDVPAPVPVVPSVREDGRDDGDDLNDGLELADLASFDRKAFSRGDAAQASVAAAVDAVRSGLHILVYPEGTRSLDGKLSAFKKGPFFLALETKAPIIPVVVSGTQTMMRKGSSAITPGLAKVHLLPAIEPSGYATREELMVAVKSAIAEALPPEMKSAT